MALTSYGVLQLQHLSYIRVGSRYDGISLDKRPGKAHLELLVAACNNFEKIFVVHKFSNLRKTRKMSSSKIKGYTVHIYDGTHPTFSNLEVY